MLTAEQQAIRATGIGASEMPAIVGADGAFGSAFEVWARKVGLADQREETRAMRVGTVCEEAIAKLYELETGRKLALCDTVRHPVETWALATCDRAVVGEERVVECKTVGAYMLRNWKRDEEDGIPESVLIQANFQGIVTGVRKVDVAMLCGTDFRIYEIECDPEIGEHLLTIGRRFWHEHVLKRVPPPPDGSEATRRTIEAMFPNAARDLLDATPEAEELARAYAAARESESEAAKHKEAIGNRLRALIGDASGFVGKWGKVTWTPNARGPVAWKAVAEELGATPELIAKHTSQPSRVLRVTVKEK